MNNNHEKSQGTGLQHSYWVTISDEDYHNIIYMSRVVMPLIAPTEYVGKIGNQVNIRSDIHLTPPPENFDQLEVLVRKQIPVHDCTIKIRYAYEYEILNRTFKEIGGVTFFKLFNISSGNKYYDLASIIKIPFQTIPVTPKQFQDYAKKQMSQGK